MNVQDGELVGEFLQNALAAGSGSGMRQWNLLVADEDGFKLGKGFAYAISSGVAVQMRAKLPPAS